MSELSLTGSNPLMVFLDQERRTNGGNAQNLNSAIGATGAIMGLQDKQTARDAATRLRIAKESGDVDAIAKIDPKQAAELDAFKRERAFRSPENIARFTTGAAEAIAPPADDLGGGPGRPAIPGKLDRRAMIEEGAMQGVPHAYQMLNNMNTTDATREAAAARIQQAAQNATQMFQVRMQNAKTAQERAQLQREHNQIMEQIHIAATNFAGRRLNYDIGGGYTPIAQPAGTGASEALTAAPGAGTMGIQPAAAGGEMSGSANPAELVSRIQNPADRAAAMAQLSGQTGASTALAGPAPVQAPQAAPVAAVTPPVTAPPAPPDNFDARDLRTGGPASQSPALASLPQEAAAIAAGAKPTVLQNSGNISTEKTITVEADGKHYVIPTIINGQSYTPEAAASAFMARKIQPLGAFATAQEAQTYAESRSRELDRAFGGSGRLITGASDPASGGVSAQFPATAALNAPPAAPAAPAGPKYVTAADAPPGMTGRMADAWARDANKAAMSGATGQRIGDFSKNGPEFLASIPESDRQIVRQLANYNLDPKTLSTRGGQRERMLSMVSQYDPTYDDTQYANKRAAITRFGSGPQGNTVRSLNVAIEHLDTLKRAADALNNKDMTGYNKVANEVGKFFGKEPPNTFEGLRDMVANEVVKGTVGGAGALHDREEAARKIKAAASPAQMAGIFNGWTELMGGQVKGLERQYEATTRNKDFRERYLTEHTRRAIDLAESKAAAAPQNRRATDNQPAATPGGASVSNW